jgi:hypothetical protein
MSKVLNIRQVPPQQSAPFWERETPVEVRTKHVALCYFPETGWLQVSKLYRDAETGEQRYGKTVTAGKAELQNPEFTNLLARIAEDWRSE